MPTSIGQQLKTLRQRNNLTQKALGQRISVAESTISLYETGKRNPDLDTLRNIADALSTTADYLLGYTGASGVDAQGFAAFPVIGAITAGYDGSAMEEFSDSVEYIPKSELKGLTAADFFVLRVKGESMYPQFLNGDRVLVQRCTSVDSDAVAVIMYNNEEATLKKVRYVYGEDWLELIPVNPEYPPRRVEGPDLECCRVLGRVVKLIRDV